MENPQYQPDTERSKNLSERLTKFYFYTNAGNGLISSFKSLIEGVLLAYLALHLSNPLLLPLMAAMGIPALFLLGWYAVNYMNRVMDKLSVKNGTYYAIRQFELVEQTAQLTAENVELNKQILIELKKLNGNQE